MSIIATAPVPAFNRLDAATTLALFPACPAWCTDDGQGPDHLHEHITAVTAQDAAFFRQQATAAVIVQRHDDATGPTQVQLTITEGAEGGYAGFQGTQGWAGTPEQAERLALALIEGARIVREIAAGAR